MSEADLQTYRIIGHDSRGKFLIPFYKTIFQLGLVILNIQM